MPETNSDFSPRLGMGHTFLSHMERHGTLNKIRVPTARKEIIAWASDGLGSNPDSATFPLSNSLDLGCHTCKTGVLMGPNSQSLREYNEPRTQRPALNRPQPPRPCLQPAPQGRPRTSSHSTALTAGESFLVSPQTQIESCSRRHFRPHPGSWEGKDAWEPSAQN